MMRKGKQKFYVSVLLAVGIATGVQDGHHSFYEGHIVKIDLTKKLSGHDGQWNKEKRLK